MAKLNSNAFTDYPDGVCRPITVLSYDNNKYCLVEYHEIMDLDGRRGFTHEIKRGYISRTPYTEGFEGYTSLSAVDYHILGGGDRRSYRPRIVKREWHVYDFKGWSPSIPTFDTLKEAIKYARAYLLHSGEKEVEIGLDHSAHTRSGYSGSSNCVTVVVHDDGNVIRYNNDRSSRSRLHKMERRVQGTFIEGKIENYGPRHQVTKRAWANGRRT